MQHGELSTDCCPRNYRQVLPARVQVRLPHPLPQDTSDDISSRPGRSDDTGIPVSGNRLRDLLEWSKEFTDDLEDDGVLASRDHTRKHLSGSIFGTSCKSGTEESTVSLLTSRKTEIAKYAREPRSQGLFAGSALVMQYFVQKIR